VEHDAVARAVAAAGRSGGRDGTGPGTRRGSGADAGPGEARPARESADPVARLQHSVLEAVLQHPSKVDAEVFDALPDDAFSVPALRAVHEAIRAAGGVGAVASAGGEAAWLERVREEAAGPVAGTLTELAVAPLPEDRPEAIEDYVRGVVAGLVDVLLTRQIADLRGRLQRTDPEQDPDGYQAVFAELIALEQRRKNLRAGD